MQYLVFLVAINNTLHIRKIRIPFEVPLFKLSSFIQRKNFTHHQSFVSADYNGWSPIPQMQYSEKRPQFSHRLPS